MSVNLNFWDNKKANSLFLTTKGQEIQLYPLLLVYGNPIVY